MSAVIDEAAGVAATDVEAVLNYTRNEGVRPVNYTFEPPPGVPRNSGEIDARRVTIHDARRVRGLALDVSGFEMISHGRPQEPYRRRQSPDLRSHPSRQHRRSRPAGIARACAPGSR